uniref:Uncharacterized protein n=1 Tax=Athene cunicularia TaxID=194338 RepID=A0A663NE62_ATHCN
MSYWDICREASHTDSCDTASGPQQNSQLEGWLSQVQSTKRHVRAIVAPCVGYTYCGSVCYPGKERTRAMLRIDRA